MGLRAVFTATARAFTYIVGELVSEPEKVMALVADLNAVRDKYMAYLEQRAAGAT